MSAQKCEGACDEHHGEIKHYRVVGQHTPPGDYWYCDVAAEHDVDEGFVVRGLMDEDRANDAEAEIDVLKARVAKLSIWKRRANNLLIDIHTMAIEENIVLGDGEALEDSVDWVIDWEFPVKETAREAKPRSRNYEQDQLDMDRLEKEND